MNGENMIHRIKYKIKKIKSKLYIELRNKYSLENIKKMSHKKRILLCLKEIILNPIKFFKILFKKNLNIKYIEIVLTTKCTLNCKGCSALMNYYDKHVDIPLVNIINSLNNLLKACDTIIHLRLLGGEPLCYKNLYEVLEFINDQDKIKKITIVTNGTLLIKDDRVIKLLKKERFNIYISNYGKISRMKEELINQLNDNKIKYSLCDEDYMWRDYGDMKCRNRNKKELKKQFYNCYIMCTSIFNGQLHHCPRSSHGTNLKLVPLKESDYINLLDNNISLKQLRKKLYNFFYNYIPYIEACNYCNSATKELKYMKPATQIKK